MEKPKKSFRMIEKSFYENLQESFQCRKVKQTLIELTFYRHHLRNYPYFLSRGMASERKIQIEMKK